MKKRGGGGVPKSLQAKTPRVEKGDFILEIIRGGEAARKKKNLGLGGCGVRWQGRLLSKAKKNGADREISGGGIRGSKEKWRR